MRDLITIERSSCIGAENYLHVILLIIFRHMKSIPNLITLTNLLFGCAALLSILQGHFTVAAWWLVAAAIADFADGLVARGLGVSSPVGKELDSLADLISFGLVPGTILYVLLNLGTRGEVFSTSINWEAFPAFILSAASALRLARFNLDERQTEGFIGLATPACTLLVLGLLIFYQQNAFGLSHFLTEPLFLWPLIGVLSYLLLAEIPMFSFKFKHLGWEGNGLRFIFAGLSIALLLFLQELAIAPIMLLYIIINVVRHITKQFDGNN